LLSVEEKAQLQTTFLTRFEALRTQIDID
jgi:hypothetical protein